MIKPAEFIHPEDAAALRQLESIPGFPALVKKIMALGIEQLLYGLNMGQQFAFLLLNYPNFIIICLQYVSDWASLSLNSIYKWILIRMHGHSVIRKSISP